MSGLVLRYHGESMGPQYVYTMKGLGKRYAPDHTVLKDIWLSFLPGAKIGILGLNGSGKSTLLRIMAGVITEFEGEAFTKDDFESLLPIELELKEHNVTNIYILVHL